MQAYLRDLNLGLSQFLHGDLKWGMVPFKGASGGEIINKLSEPRLYTVDIEKHVHLHLKICIIQLCFDSIAGTKNEATG